MRDELLGYLLNALDDHEHDRIADQLARDPALQRDLDVLRRGVAPLEGDRGHFDPPPQLAARTCEFVRHRSAILVEPPARVASRWSMQDMSVAAGIFVAASLLFFPAFSHSRFNAQLAACQNNMRMIGTALLNYSERHGGYFPEVTMNDHGALAGGYASKLVDTGFLECPQTFVCPSSPLVQQVGFQVPKCSELENSSPEKMAQYQGVLGGSYGYCLGYEDGGVYFSPQNGGRSSFVVMADDPGSAESQFVSPNHGQRGQNVWFEDGHVQFLTTCQSCAGQSDNIFVNDDGVVAPGCHRDDSVIASGIVPLMPVKSH